MKNTKKGLLTLVIALCSVTLIISSCKKDFDAPPAYIDPNITPTNTIAQLKLKHSSGGFEYIAGDTVISGIVVGNDISGNLYKELYIQDSTGGIAIEMDRATLFGDYPLGRRVYVKTKGLYLSDYGGVIQIGAIDRSIPNNPTLTGIPSSLLDVYVIKGALGPEMAPVVITDISQLTTNIQDKYIGTLIQLPGYEFAKGDTGRIYADTSATKKSVNFVLKDCGGLNSITLRNSGYANFAGFKVPKGNGTVTGIYTIFSTTKQILIRDTTDLKMNGSRCNLFEEDFGTVVNNTLLDFPGWKNIGEVGGLTWIGKTFGSTGKVAYISAFNSGQDIITSWLITPPIKITSTTSPVLTFTTSERYEDGATITALVSTDYNGGNNPSASTWMNLNATIASGFTGSTYSPFTPSGPLSLAPYVSQTFYIAFRYDGADPASGTKHTTSFELDDIKIK